MISLISLASSRQGMGYSSALRPVASSGQSGTSPWPLSPQTDELGKASVLLPFSERFGRELFCCLLGRPLWRGFCLSPPCSEGVWRRKSDLANHPDWVSGWLVLQELLPHAGSLGRRSNNSFRKYEILSGNQIHLKKKGYFLQEDYLLRKKSPLGKINFLQKIQNIFRKIVFFREGE